MPDLFNGFTQDDPLPPDPVPVAVAPAPVAAPIVAPTTGIVRGVARRRADDPVPVAPVQPTSQGSFFPQNGAALGNPDTGTALGIPADVQPPPAPSIPGLEPTPKALAIPGLEDSPAPSPRDSRVDGTPSLVPGLETPLSSGNRPVVDQSLPPVPAMPSPAPSVGALPSQVASSSSPNPTSPSPADKPYDVDASGNLKMDPSRLRDSILQANKQGLVTDDAVKELLPQAQAVEDAHAELVKAAGGNSEAKAAIEGLTKGGIGLGGFFAGAAGGAAIGAAVPVIGETGLSELVGGLIGGFLSVSAANKVEKQLAKYSDAVKSFQAAAAIHPYISGAGEIIPQLGLGVKGVQGLAALAEVGGTKAVAAQLGRGALAGAGVETIARPAIQNTQDIISDALGIEHDPTQAPTAGSILQNALFGAVLSGHGLQDNAPNQATLQNIAQRGLARETNVGPDGKPAPIPLGAQFSNIVADAQNGPLSLSEQALYSQLKQAAKKYGVGLGDALSGENPNAVSARQITTKGGTPLATQAEIGARPELPPSPTAAPELPPVSPASPAPMSPELQQLVADRDLAQKALDIPDASEESKARASQFLQRINAKIAARGGAPADATGPAAPGIPNLPGPLGSPNPLSPNAPASPQSSVASPSSATSPAVVPPVSPESPNAPAPQASASAEAGSQPPNTNLATVPSPNPATLSPEVQALQQTQLGIQRVVGSEEYSPEIRQAAQGELDKVNAQIEALGKGAPAQTGTPQTTPGETPRGTPGSEVASTSPTPPVSDTSLGEPEVSPSAQRSTQNAEGNVTFETSKGSQYSVNELGHTTRLKLSAGRGQGEVHEASPAVFVKPADQEGIMSAMQGGGRLVLGAQDADGSFKQIQPDSTADIRGQNVGVYVLDRATGQVIHAAPATTTPEVGLHPVEVRYDGDTKSIHVGNEITKVSTPSDNEQVTTQHPAQENARPPEGQAPTSTGPATAGRVPRVDVETSIPGLEPASGERTLTKESSNAEPTAAPKEEAQAEQAGSGSTGPSVAPRAKRRTDIRVRRPELSADDARHAVETAHREASASNPATPPLQETKLFEPSKYEAPAVQPVRVPRQTEAREVPNDSGSGTKTIPPDSDRAAMAREYIANEREAGRQPSTLDVARKHALPPVVATRLLKDQKDAEAESARMRLEHREEHDAQQDEARSRKAGSGIYYDENTGKIHHDPEVVAKVLQSFARRNQDGNAWLKSAIGGENTLGEESIHRLDERASLAGEGLQAEREKVWNALPEENQSLAKAAYGPITDAPHLSPEDQAKLLPNLMGAEYMRMLYQRRNGLPLTESHFRDTKQLEAVLDAPQPEAVEKHLAAMQRLAGNAPQLPVATPQSNAPRSETAATTPQEAPSSPPLEASRTKEVPSPSSPPATTESQEARQSASGGLSKGDGLSTNGEVVSGNRPAIRQGSDENDKAVRQAAAETSRQEVERIRAGDASSKNRGVTHAPEPPTGELKRIDLPLDSLDPKTIEHLRESTDQSRIDRYAKEGIKEPVYVHPSRSGKLTVSDGGHRVLAAFKRGDKTIPALVPAASNLSDSRSSSTPVEGQRVAGRQSDQPAPAISEPSADVPTGVRISEAVSSSSRSSPDSTPSKRPSNAEVQKQAALTKALEKAVAKNPGARKMAEQARAKLTEMERQRDLPQQSEETPRISPTPDEPTSSTANNDTSNGGTASLIQAVHARTEAGIRTGAELVQDDTYPGAVGCRATVGDRPVILYNPKETGVQMERMRERGSDPDAYLRSAIDEEHIHARDFIAGGVKSPDIWKSIWSKLPSLTKARVRQLRPEIESPLMLAAEYIRALYQRRVGSVLAETHVYPERVEPLLPILDGVQPRLVERHIAAMRAIQEALSAKELDTTGDMLHPEKADNPLFANAKGAATKKDSPFADQVAKAVVSIPTSERYGSDKDKVLISQAYDAYRAQKGAMNLAEFKQSVIAELPKGTLKFSRADLGTNDPKEAEERRLSKTEYLGETFHYIRTDGGAAMERAKGRQLRAANPLTLHRAANEPEARTGAHFTEEEDDAKAYQDNPGFGGKNLYHYNVDPSRTLDATGDLTDLAQAYLDAGGDMPRGVYIPEHDDNPDLAHYLAEDWKDSGFDHVFQVLENRPDVERELGNAHDWVKYKDDFPAGSTTWKYLGSKPLQLTSIPPSSRAQVAEKGQQLLASNPSHAFTPEKGGILYHGTNAPEFKQFRGSKAFGGEYLAPDPENADDFSGGVIPGTSLHGETPGVSRVIKVQAKPGKALELDNDPDFNDALENGELDDYLAKKAPAAKAAGYRYLTHSHPSTDGSKDFKAHISLYPKDDLTPVQATPKVSALESRYLDVLKEVKDPLAAADATYYRIKQETGKAPNWGELRSIADKHDAYGQQINDAVMNLGQKLRTNRPTNYDRTQSTKPSSETEVDSTHGRSNAAIPSEGASESSDEPRRFTPEHADEAVVQAIGTAVDRIGDDGVDITSSADDPDSSGFWINGDGTIQYNPIALARSMQVVAKAGGDPSEWLTSALEEEMWHGRDFRASRPSFQSLHRAMAGMISKNSLRELYRTYGAELPPAEAAAEYLRMLAQRFFGTPLTESHYRDTSKMEAILDRDQPRLIGAHLEKMIAQIGGDETRRLFASNPLRADDPVDEPTTWAKASDALSHLMSRDGAIGSALDDIAKVFVPAARGEHAKLGAEALQEIAAIMARNQVLQTAVLKGMRNIIARKPQAQQREDIFQRDEGKPPDDPDYAKAFDAIKKLDAERLDAMKPELKKYGIDDLEDFHRYADTIIPHQFTDPDKAEQVFSNLEKKMSGGTGFLKHRGEYTLRELSKFGLEPKSYNFVDLISARWWMQERFLGALKLADEMEKAGSGHWETSDYTPKADEEEIGHRILRKTGQVDGKPRRQKFYAEKEAALIVKNYLSEGLRGKAWFQAYTHVANTLNNTQLSLSAFHGGFISAESITSQVANAIKLLADGDFAGAAKAALKAPISPILDYKLGKQLVGEWNKPGSQSDAIANMLRQIISGGGRGNMDSIYNEKATEKFMDALHSKAYSSAVLRAPFAAIELLARPITEKYVPYLKAAAAAKMIQAELARHPNASVIQQRSIAAEAVRSVNNRFGQMVYDNLHLHKVTKDILMGMTRSLGWNWGTFAELGGGVKDFLKAGIDLTPKIRKGGGGKGGEPPEGPDGPSGSEEEDPLFSLGGFNVFKGRKPIFTQKMAYVLALPLVAGIMGAVINAAFGQKAHELKDYYFPKTGDKDAKGRDIRLSLPTYMKDVFAFVDSPTTTITNKLHPLLSMIGQMFSNKDFYGTEIRHQDDPYLSQAIQELKFVGKNLLPFTVTNLAKTSEEGASPAVKALGFVGFGKAAARIGETDAEKLADQLVIDRMPQGTRTQAEADKGQLKAKILNAARNKDLQPLRSALAAGTITSKEASNIVRRSSLTPLQDRVHSLDLVDAQRVLAVANADEKKELAPVVDAKIAAAQKASQPARQVAANKVPAFAGF